MSVLDLTRFSAAKRKSEPFHHFLGDSLLRSEAIDVVDRDFPKLKNAGYLTLREIEPEGEFKTFLDELQSRELSAAVSELLEFNLVDRPTLITIMRWCPKRAGRIHTDGKSKLATMLVYFNREWTAGHAGAVRALNSPDDVEDVVTEVEPLMGNFFGFLRSDNSWHGHLPFEGERKVVQITWLESEEAVERKRRNNALAQTLKSLWGGGRDKADM